MYSEHRESQVNNAVQLFNCSTENRLIHKHLDRHVQDGLSLLGIGEGAVKTLACLSVMV
jgi:hypothetical protein